MRDLVRRSVTTVNMRPEIFEFPHSDMESDKMPMRNSSVASCRGLINKGLGVDRLELGGNTCPPHGSGNTKNVTCV